MPKNKQLAGAWYASRSGGGQCTSEATSCHGVGFSDAPSSGSQPPSARVVSWACVCPGRQQTRQARVGGILIRRSFRPRAQLCISWPHRRGQGTGPAPRRWLPNQLMPAGPSASRGRPRRRQHRAPRPPPAQPRPAIAPRAAPRSAPRLATRA